jgi:hypothetical protein
MFSLCRLTSGACTIDFSTLTFTGNLNEHPIFWVFVNAQDLLEVTTKLPVKLNDPVIDVGT